MRHYVKKTWLYGLVGLLCFLIWEFSGCSTAPPGPKFTVFSLQPTELDMLGGEVQITATVESNTGNAPNLVAHVSGPDVADDTVTLVVTGSKDTSYNYAGTYDFSGNPAQDETDKVFGIYLEATDSSGQVSTANTKNVTVEAAPRPPDGPGPLLD